MYAKMRLLLMPATQNINVPSHSLPFPNHESLLLLKAFLVLSPQTHFSNPYQHIPVFVTRMTSHPDWNAKTSGAEVASTFSSAIKDKVILITGVSPNGLGEELATILDAHAPATLILLTRHLPEGHAVADKLKAKTVVVEIDFSSRLSLFYAEHDKFAVEPLLSLEIVSLLQHDYPHCSRVSKC